LQNPNPVFMPHKPIPSVIDKLSPREVFNFVVRKNDALVPDPYDALVPSLSMTADGDVLLLIERKAMTEETHKTRLAK